MPHHAQWLRLEVSWLIQNQLIEFGRSTNGELSWPDGRHLSYKAYYTAQEKWIQLDYEFRDVHNDWTTQELHINIAIKPSNLGTGEIPFFVCPESGRYCRILYHGHGFSGWKSRKSYSKRAITGSESLSPSTERFNTLYWRLKHTPEFKELGKKYEQPNVKTTYNGQKTNWVLRYEQLQKELDFLDKMRWIEKKAGMRKLQQLV